MSFSFALYGVIIYFVYYFSTDLIYKQNPRIKYEETEFKYPVNFPLKDLFNTTSLGIYIEVKSKDLIYNTTVGKTKNLTTGEFNIGSFYIENFGLYNLKKQILFNNYPAYIDAYESQDCAPLQPPCFDNLINIQLDENATIKVSNSSSIINNSTSIKEINNYNFKLDPQDRIYIGFYRNSGMKKFNDGVKTFIIGISYWVSIKNNIINADENSFIKSFENDQRGEIQYNNNSQTYQYIQTIANYGLINLKTDKGFIFSDIENKTSLKKNYDYAQTHSEKYLSGDVIFYKINVDIMSRNYERVYKKLQNVFADLGGLFNSFLLIGNILIVQFNKMKFDYDLINKVFQIQTEIINQLKSKPPIIEDQSTSRLPIKNNSNDIQESNIISNDSHRQKELGLFNSKNATVELKRFHISSVKEMKNKSQQDINQNKEFKSIENNKNKVENIHEDTAKNNNIKEFYNKYNNKLYKKPLKYSKLDFFMTFLCCQNLKNPNLIAKVAIFKQAQAQVYDDMDIVNYISLFEKFEKLISILLNEYQAISFNFMQNRSLSGLQTNRISEESITKVLDYYRCQIKDSRTSLIDDRLIKSFYPSFSDLIQKDSKAE